MKVIDYLHTHSLAELAQEFTIKVTEHPTLPLVILNYDQLDSPKTNPIVMECRGLCLEKDTWKVVARAFNRFFNWGECIEFSKEFDWDSAKCSTKLDGSLILCYWIEGKWRINTRGSFAQGRPIDDPTCPTWEELFLQASGYTSLENMFQDQMTDHTYVFELCSLYNKVIQHYPESKLYFLAMVNNATGITYCQDYLHSRVCDWIGVEAPNHWSISSIEDVKRIVEYGEAEDPTFEGVVIHDSWNHRWKVKSPTYIALHQLKCNGAICLPKHLVPIILRNEVDEVLAVFPELEEPIQKVKKTLDEAYQDLKIVWGKGWEIPQNRQKEFALTIKDSKFSGILFRLRKEHGLEETEKHLQKAWQGSTDLILKVLF